MTDVITEDRVMEVTETTIAQSIKTRVSVVERHFVLVTVRATTDAILLVRQLRENYFAKINRCIWILSTWGKCLTSSLNLSFWWSMRRLVIDE